MRAFTHNVTTSATQVTAPKGTTLAPNLVLIKNPTGSGQVAYIGGNSSVTTSTGFPLAAGESMSVDLADEELWVIAAAGVTVNLLSRF